MKISALLGFKKFLFIGDFGVKLSLLLMSAIAHIPTGNRNLMEGLNMKNRCIEFWVVLRFNVLDLRRF